MRSPPKNRGTVSLLVAGLVLPFLFLAFSLGIDLTFYQARRTAAQSILDNAALHAVRFLPYREQAAFAALEFATRGGLDPQFISASAPAGEDRVIISYNKSMQMMFPALLGVDINLPIAALSAARITPKDTLIIADFSSALSPNPAIGTPWGTGSQWDAQFFNGQSFGTASSVIASQQCFNPVLNSYKRAIMDLYDYLASFRYNQIGISVAPAVASVGGIDTLRPVSVGGFQGGSEVQYLDGGTPIRNAECFAVSETEPQSSPNYQNFALPAANEAIGSPSVPPAGRPLQLVDPNGWVIPFANLPFVTAREAIWSQVVRWGAGATALHPDLSRLVIEGFNSIGASGLAGRGTLGAHASKELVIVLADLPWEGGVRFGQTGFSFVNTFQNLQSLKDLSEQNQIYTRVRVVLFSHPGVCNDPSSCDQFRTDARQVEAQLEQYSSSGSEQYFRVQVLLADGAENLQKVVSSAVSVSDKNAMLSR